MADLGTLEITDAYLIKPTRGQVGETTAQIGYACAHKLTKKENVEKKESHTAYAQINSATGTYIYRETYTYDGPYFEWKIKDASPTSDSGQTKITGLNKGAPNAISGKVKVYYKVHIDYYEQTYRFSYFNTAETPPRTGVTVQHSEREWDSDEELSASKSVTFPQDESDPDPWYNLVWTRPGYYFFEKYPKYEIKQGDYIHKKLTTSVMGAWDTLLDITGHWFNQNGQNATEDSTYTENCIISPGDVITAKWFNACITLLTRYEGFDPLGRAEATATVGGPGVYEETSYITAARINLMLGANGEKGEV